MVPENATASAGKAEGESCSPEKPVGSRGSGDVSEEEGEGKEIKGIKIGLVLRFHSGTSGNLLFCDIL